MKQVYELERTVDIQRTYQKLIYLSAPVAGCFQRFPQTRRFCVIECIIPSKKTIRRGLPLELEYLWRFTGDATWQFASSISLPPVHCHFQLHFSARCGRTTKEMVKIRERERERERERREEKKKVEGNERKAANSPEQSLS